MTSNISPKQLFIKDVSLSKMNYRNCLPYIQSPSKALKFELPHTMKPGYQLPTIKNCNGRPDRKVAYPHLGLLMTDRRKESIKKSHNPIFSKIKTENDGNNFQGFQNSRTNFQIRDINGSVASNRYHTERSQTEKDLKTTQNTSSKFQMNGEQSSIGKSSGSTHNFHRQHSMRPKCLVVNSKRIPFSLDKKSDTKNSTKKLLRNCDQQLFDLNISQILNDDQAPQSPFISISNIDTYKFLQMC